MRSRAVKAVSKATGLKQKAIRKSTTVKKLGKGGDLQARVKFRGQFLSVIHFGARQTKKGVSARPWGKRRVYERSFFGNQKRTVFRRDASDPRLPIEPVYGPAVPREAAREAVVESIDAVVKEEFPKLLKHEVSRELKNGLGN